MPTVYRSSDASAPVVTGASVGSFLAMLRACLVNGYGSKAAAGWTEAFTGTNVAAFRNDPSGGTGCYVRVADTAVDSGVCRVEIKAYSIMTDVNTGSDVTAAVHAGRRSGSTSSTSALEWVVVADQYTFYVTARTPGNNIYMCGAGDIHSFQTSDAFRYFVCGDPSNTTVFNAAPAGMQCSNSNSAFFGGSPSNVFISLGRDHTGIGSAASSNMLMPILSTVSAPTVNSYIGGTNFPARPSANGIAEAALPAYIGRQQVIRGKLRGVYVPLSDLVTSFSAGTLAPDVNAPDFGGASSVVIPMLAGNGTNAGGIWVETALAW